MIRMLGTGGPTRVDEPVMQTLLNVVNDALLEIRRIDRQHANAGDCLLNLRFVTTANGLDEILFQQVSHTVCIRLGDRGLSLQVPAGLLAGGAVGHAATNDQVGTAECLEANDAHADIFDRPKRPLALRTGQRSIALPHGQRLATKTVISLTDAPAERRGSPSRRSQFHQPSEYHSG